MPETSLFTDVKRNIVDELRDAKKTSAKTNAVPFGLERLSRQSLVVARFEKMSEPEKRAFIARNGVAETARMMGRKNAG